ncbi:MAG: chitosanase [Anaerolineae bacterium]|nr:chitosanase [Anaerolineae bacterium]
MANVLCKASVRTESDFARINVRKGPGTNTEILTTLAVGTMDLTVRDVQPDQQQKAALSGKVYQWFNVDLPDGGRGWIRDDLLDIVGDCGSVGYSSLSTPTWAFGLTRVEVIVRPPGDPERVRKAAFNITAGFEGGGYATYQNRDDGVISYGRFQFTLASGSLFSVLDKYLQKATGSIADQLRSQYYEPIKARDANLRNDQNLKNLLVAAAPDPIMQEAQDAVATDVYWNAAMNLSAVPRNINSALGRALLFDMAINHGLRHDMIALAEGALSLPVRGRLPDLATEKLLIAKLAEVRQDRMNKLAVKLNAPGLKQRGDFWVAYVATNDWDLLGDLNGNVTIKPGRTVQVKNP